MIIIYTLVHKIIDSLHAAFSLNKLGAPKYFLGIEIKRLSTSGLLLIQTKYIHDLLPHAKMCNVNCDATHMLNTCHHNKPNTSSLSDPHLYFSIDEALQYVSLMRPDIAFNVNESCQPMKSLLEYHWAAIKRILRYLSGIITHGLFLSPAPLS